MTYTQRVDDAHVVQHDGLSINMMVMLLEGT